MAVARVFASRRRLLFCNFVRDLKARRAAARTELTQSLSKDLAAARSTSRGRSRNTARSEQRKARLAAKIEAGEELESFMKNISRKWKRGTGSGSYCANLEHTKKERRTEKETGELVETKRPKSNKGISMCVYSPRGFDELARIRELARATKWDRGWQKTKTPQTNARRECMPDKAVGSLWEAFSKRCGVALGVLLTFWFHPSVGVAAPMRSAWAVFPKWMLLSLAHLDHEGRGFKATSKGSTQIGFDLVLAKTTIRRNRMATISITSNVAP